MEFSGTSFVTTAPAPIIELLPIFTGRIVAFDPIRTLSPTIVSFKIQFSAFGTFESNKSFVKVTECAMKQFLPIATPSQRKL